MYDRRDGASAGAGSPSAAPNSPAPGKQSLVQLLPAGPGQAPAAEVPTANPAPNQPTAAPAAPASGEVYSAGDAKAVQDNWTAHGAESESDTQVKTSQFRAWMDHASAAITTATKLKSNPIGADHANELRTWIKKFDLHEKWRVNSSGKEPEDPGAVPADLPALSYAGKPLGAPPVAYVKAKQYDVTTVDGDKRTYTDHVQSPNTTSDTGVGDSGKVGGAAKIADVFDKAGVPSPDPATVKKVFSILSSLEGKFDAINTYDAGYVSAGFIQFITAKDGKGSLSSVLRDMKAKAPAEFNTYFHSVGIDVDAKGLVVVDPASGGVLHGEPAVQKVMDDKRLTAAFQAAGAKSSEFQYAQARTAYAQYYVPDHSFSVALSVKDPANAAKKKQVTLTGHYSDVLKSEAGKVASVDRGVQHGTGGGHGSGGAAGRFLDACQAVVDKHQLTDAVDVATLATYEAEIVPRMHNRYAESSDGTLTQPPAVPATAPAAAKP
ncbi:MAG TPA: hypothetical protein VH165_17075 [Kofleriaceae bacterium]|nr:hypothetical protein [Kofleriaceae bacterium]